MEESKRYVRLGVFMVVCLTILVAVLLLLGGRQLFQPTFTFETYFNESVSGLDVGAPVRFRGVPLGEVSEILTSSATYEADIPLADRRTYIVVRAKLNVSPQEAEQIKDNLVPMVRRGLRAQTQLAGITGQQYLVIDFLDPAKNPPLEYSWTPKYTYLPSAPSLTGQIVAHAQAFLASLNEADIKTMSRNANTLLVDLDKKLNAAQVEKLIGNTNAMIGRIDGILAAAPIDHTLRKLDSASGRLDTLLAEPALKRTVDNLDRVVARLDGTLERLDTLLGDNQYDARVIVQDLRVTANNLRMVSETIRQYPAGTLLGGPPEKVQLPGNSR